MKLNAARNSVPGLWCLRYAHMEMLQWRLIGVSLAVLCAVVLTIAILGPLGTEARLGFLQRLAFVTLSSVCCWPICHAVSTAILYVGRKLRPVHMLLASISGKLFLAVPCSAVSFTVLGLFEPPGDAYLRLPEIYLNSVVVALAFGCIVHYMACQRVQLRYSAEAGAESASPDREDTVAGQTSTFPQSAPDSRDRFFDRLPEMMGRDIVYLTVSGHYVNVVTTAGSCLVLMRLADAGAALGDLGMRVHRSYWVALRHVTGVVQRDGRMVLRMTGSHEIPVSRTHMAATRSAISSAGKADS